MFWQCGGQLLQSCTICNMVGLHEVDCDPQCETCSFYDLGHCGGAREYDEHDTSCPYCDTWACPGHHEYKPEFVRCEFADLHTDELQIWCDKQFGENLVEITP